MSVLAEGEARTDIINRLKRAEGQMRGIQRMVAEGATCMDIAVQLAAVGRAVESAGHRLTTCFMQQEVLAFANGNAPRERLDGLSVELQAMLAKLR
jgi:CsoR family transcriptional regulator, copper-sensing transcriptional repressor